MLPFLLCLVSLSLSCSAQQSISDFYKERAMNKLIKGDKLPDCFDFTSTGLAVYQIEGKLKTKEFFVSWDDVNQLKKALQQNKEKELWDQYQHQTHFDWNSIVNSPPKVANPKRIALSPGHLAQSWKEARYEGKYIQFTREKLSFYEAELNLQTAQLLKKILEQRGYDVFISRDDHHKDVWDMGFNNFLKKGLKPHIQQALKDKLIGEHQKNWFYKTSKRNIYRYLYASLELRARAKYINEFNPDLCLILHLNVNVNNSPWLKPCGENKQMFFIPGSFLPNEFKRKEDRFNFIRLLLSEQMEESTNFAKKCSQEVFNKLQISQAQQNDALYLKNFSLPTTEEGIFHRNLSMCRTVYAPLAYAEPLYQDNIEMAQQLAKNPEELLHRLALAYADAIDSYFQEKENLRKK